MPDVEKVIKGLERCLVCNTSAITSAEGEKAYRDCEYTVALYCRQDKLLRDVLELLKQEAVKPVHDKVVGRIWLCVNCGVLITESMNYCHKCGKRIEWEGR